MGAPDSVAGLTIDLADNTGGSAATNFGCSTADLALTGDSASPGTALISGPECRWEGSRGSGMSTGMEVSVGSGPAIIGPSSRAGTLSNSAVRMLSGS